MGASSSKDPCEIAYNNIFSFEINTGPAEKNVMQNIKTKCNYTKFMNKIPLDNRPNICEDLKTIYSNVDKKNYYKTKYKIGIQIML